MVDKQVVTERLAKIRESAKRLRPLAEGSKEAFSGDADQQLKAERLVEIAAQAMIDIGSHLVASKGLRKPQEYAEVFAILGEAQLLPAAFAKRLEKLAGLRNLLVHEYLDIDPGLLHDNLKNYLGDFEQFAQVVAKLV